MLAAPQSSPAVLFGLYDVLFSVGAVFSDMTVGVPGTESMRVMIASEDGKPFRCIGDVLIEPHAAITAIDHADAVIVCDMYTPIHQAPIGKYPAICEWLRALHASGAMIASVCSGALVLAESGLLDGRQTAAHWAYSELFSQSYPKVRMRRESVLCLAEEADRIVTAGGVTSWQELAIYLIARFCGQQQARETAKVHLLYGHDGGQLPFAAMNVQVATSDATIAECQRWISANYAMPDPIERLAERSGLTPRTLARRFKTATGRTPIDYVQSVRVEEAKRILETEVLHTDGVSALVGYEDPASFRRMFGARVGLSPAAYRRKFARVGAVAAQGRTQEMKD